MARIYRGPWLCPYCGQKTVNSYRCSNLGCEKDLAGRKLSRVAA